MTRRGFRGPAPSTGKSAWSVIPASLVAIALACGGDEGPTAVESGAVTIRATGSAVRLHNRGADHVYHAVFERETATRIDFLPCTSGRESCPHVHEGETLAIAYVDIEGWEPGDAEAIVFLWELGPGLGGSGGLVAREVRSVVIGL